jgi:hypothetical protein
MLDPLTFRILPFFHSCQIPTKANNSAQINLDAEQLNDSFGVRSPQDHLPTTHDQR